MVHSKIIHPEPQIISPARSAGKMLSAARVEWDLTVEEVAENLNLSAETIRSIEKDEYSTLPGYTFVKGYIRSYANLLRLDSEEVISTVDLQPEKLTEIPAIPGSIKLKGRRPQGKKKKKRRIFLKLVLLLIGLGVVGLLAMSQLSKLDTAELAEIFKLPAREKTTEQEGDELVFPSNENSTQESNTDQSKGALIRIE